MSSAEYLRQFVNERLTAAAEEIFGVFAKTIIEYEEELDRQRRLLDNVWKPQTDLNSIELPQQHVCKEEEGLSDQQQLCIQERSSSLEQEDPDPLQVKEEQEEPCTSQEGEQHVLKQQTESFMLTSTYEESDHSDDQTLDLSIGERQFAARERNLSYVSVKSSVVSEPNRDFQLLSHNFLVAESQKRGEHKDSGSTRNAETEPDRRESTSHRNNVNHPNLSESHSNTHTGKKSFKCDICGKDFKYNSLLQRHMRVHTGESPYFCKTCGKVFSQKSSLKYHIRIHTGEKPYFCEICGKGFKCNSVLKGHMRTHTGEKPYLCNTCGKRFSDVSALTRHIRIHTGEKPYSCDTCEKRFSDVSALIRHTCKMWEGFQT
ncbi:zinc finger protein 773-like [Centropristis striata]|uniref:zinc finger protein 773-like n=1 Tax=Centropristis striata TaxID=184440 RepID=UPI0027E01834|nr:zinc finger protein 773-like [Centropristis striata]